MGKIINFIFCILIGSTSVFAQSDSLAKACQEHLFKLDQSLKDMKNENAELKQCIIKAQERIKLQSSVLDSLKSTVLSNTDNIKRASNKLNIKIDETNISLQTKANAADLKSKTQWGFALLAMLFIISFVTYMLLHKRVKAAITSINESHKAQEALQNAQVKMQEESVKLDNQLLKIVQQQLQKGSIVSGNTGMPDHSLVVRLADEIARIETNLSKMDNSVRGYRQLVQAKGRMINNVRANGYEIISLLGQEYNDGMQFQTRFVPDGTLPEGKRIITGMIKMQVNYNGKMIQPAEIVVSQNI